MFSAMKESWPLQSFYTRKSRRDNKVNNKAILMSLL